MTTSVLFHLENAIYKIMCIHALCRCNNLDLRGIRQISEFKDVEVAVKMLRLQ